jgi:hypothetical protein
MGNHLFVTNKIMPVKDHHFISLYYNYCEYDSRTKLTKEFCRRYPQVHLIELAFDDKPFVINAPNSTQIRTTFTGFVNNKYINEYIKHHYANLASLTFIDSDLILFPDFFLKVIRKVEEYPIDKPLFLQPFGATYELKDEKLVSGYLESAAKVVKNSEKFDFKSHTGYIYTFNKALIDNFGTLPESLLLGSWDTFMWLGLTQETKKISNLMPNLKIRKQILDFVQDVEGSNIDYINEIVVHCYHGDKANRYNDRLALYKLFNGTSNDLELVKTYFESRKEDH